MPQNAIDYGEFGTYDVGEVKREQCWLKQVGGGTKFMKLVEGQNVVRFLPPKKGMNTPFVYVFQHFITLPGAMFPIVFACPRCMRNEACPACIKSDKLMKTGNKADTDAGRSLWATRRTYANVIDRLEQGAGPKTLGFGKQIHDDLTKIRENEAVGGDFTHPVRGFDIFITREGRGKTDTSYSVLAARFPSELGEPAWIQQQSDLSSFLRVPTWDEIKQLFASAQEGMQGNRLPSPTGSLPTQGGTQEYDDEIPF